MHPSSPPQPYLPLYPCSHLSGLPANGTHSNRPCIPLTALLDACLVVTGEDGVLALDNAGQQVVHTHLVEACDYYYIVRDDPKLDYPIFRSFDEWVPPGRAQVPDRWFTSIYPRIHPQGQGIPLYDWQGVTGTSADTLRSKAKAMDGSCRLSGFESPVEAAHIVPSAKGYWFGERKIVDKELYYPASIPNTLPVHAAIHDVRNMITLRTDIMSRWDAHAFVFIPVDGHFIAYWTSTVLD